MTSLQIKYKDPMYSIYSYWAETKCDARTEDHHGQNYMSHNQRLRYNYTQFKKTPLSQEWKSLLFAIHLHFQGLLSGILSLLTSKTHQMSNSSKVSIWGGSEIRPHNCIMQCYTDYRKYIMCTKNVNSTSWLYLYILSKCCPITLSLFYETVYVILHWPLIWYWDTNTHL